ncbi:MAG: hypothetical protein GQ569_02525 [Methylococcaceae bacterium]|nr:hypothetical protein [Methylococcaceae bacterium]
MDLKQHALQPLSYKELKFKKRLQKVLSSEDLSLQRVLVEKVAKELDIDLLDCAAALVCLSQANLYPVEPKNKIEKYSPPLPAALPKVTRLRKLQPPKMVRYRLEVGQKHNIDGEEIKNIVEDEAGVDRKMMTEMNIRYHHTFIELPEGMPADIFQLLTIATIKGQALKIKRVRFNKKRKQKK